jgi:hypothetical protein
MMTGHGFTSAFHETLNALPADGWRSATRCGPNGGNCVEVNLASRDVAGIVGIRDSKPVEGPALVFGAADWRSFLTGTIADGFHV